MILVVDIGNSNVVIGGVEGKKILFEARLRTEATKTSDEYCIDLKMFRIKANYFVYTCYC